MKIAMKAPDALKIHCKDKVFLKPKDVNAIKTELEKRRYNFTDKNLMIVLKSSKFLTRKGQAGTYSYVQRYPSIGHDENGK